MSLKHLGPVLLFAGLSLAACGEDEPGPPDISLRDVSPVWPLPKDDADATLAERAFLFAASEGDHGPILPREVFDFIPVLTRVDEPDALYSGLTVVAARLDPCFQEGRGSLPCQPNLRLVLQPLVKDEAGWEARDASVHAFYAAESEEEILGVVEGVARAREQARLSAEGPLGVHPLLEDVAGRERVRALLHPLLGAGRLVRVTSVDVHGANAAWTFSGFDWVNGAPVPITIAETGGVTSQHFLSSSPDRLETSTEPPSRSSDDFSLLLDGNALLNTAREARQAAFDAAARVENPAFHNPGTVDCVSCHVTAIARQAGLGMDDLAPSPDAFSSDHRDLTPTPNFTNAQMVRAMGYRFRELVLAPRVIHESAAVADRIDTSLRAE